jgi:hypothetical protein
MDYHLTVRPSDVSYIVVGCDLRYRFPVCSEFFTEL